MMILAVSLLIAESGAAEKKTEECMAPDANHEVVLILDDANKDDRKFQLALRTLGSDKPLYSRSAQGYVPFKLAANPTDFRCLWSHDSKFVAVFERESKRTGVTSLYLLSGEKNDNVQELAFPDLMPLIKPHLTSELRALFIRPKEWIQGRHLIFFITFTETSDQTANSFILTLKMPDANAPQSTVTLVSFVEDLPVNNTKQ